MKIIFRMLALVVSAGLLVCLVSVSLARTQNPSAQQSAGTKEKVLTNHASGTFDVKLTPQADDGGDAGVGRMSIDKQFHGDLEGTSKGQMLSAMGSVKGSAGYVAMERVTGNLKGRSGSFVLQHSGTMTRGEPQLIVSRVPAPGAGQLAGLSGTLTIKIAEGTHTLACT